MADVELCSASGPVKVKLVWSPAARQVNQVELHVEGPVTARKAVQACAQVEALERLNVWRWQPGCWGRRIAWDDVLPDFEPRIELYRPLLVDPKEARRERYRAQGPVGRFKRRPLER